MYLSKEEEKMLNGEYGEAIRLSMEILVKFGDIVKAEKLVPLKSAHVHGPYSSIRDSGVDFLEKFSNLGAKYTVLTTTNPLSADVEKWKRQKLNERWFNQVMRIIKANERMGCIPTWTCIPYQEGFHPLYGDYVAWVESSAQVTANSIYGARANRETLGIVVPAAIVGKVPKYGFRIYENRKGEILVKLKIQRLHDVDYPLIGYYLGAQVGDKIPVINGIIENSITQDRLKNLGAAAAAKGAVALYHIVGKTPEAKNINEAFHGDKPKDKLEIDYNVLKETKEEMCTFSGGKIDLVVLGCPFYSIQQIKKVTCYLKGKKINKNVKLWIFTSSYIKKLGDILGYTKIIESSNAEIYTGTCLITSFMNSLKELWGFNTIITDSGKLAYYAPTDCKVNVIYASTKECIEAALRGEYG